MLQAWRGGPCWPTIGKPAPRYVEQQLKFSDRPLSRDQGVFSSIEDWLNAIELQSSAASPKGRSRRREFLRAQTGLAERGLCGPTPIGGWSGSDETSDHSGLNNNNMGQQPTISRKPIWLGASHSKVLLISLQGSTTTVNIGTCIRRVKRAKVNNLMVTLSLMPVLTGIDRQLAYTGLPSAATAAISGFLGFSWTRPDQRDCGRSTSVAYPSPDISITCSRAANSSTASRIASRRPHFFRAIHRFDQRLLALSASRQLRKSLSIC